jgi:lysophospholipase L1-like esterase
MHNIVRSFVIYACISILCLGCTNFNKENTSAENSITQQPSFQNTKRILFLGDSITYQGGMVVNTDLWLKKLYPNKSFDIINVGLPSETITGLSEEGHADGKFPRPYIHDRLLSILDKTQPDLIIAMYGINCGIYQSYNDEHNKLYQQGYLALNRALKARNIPTVYVTPPMYDHQKGSITALDYNDKVLKSFSSWLLQNKKIGWNVIDLYSEMNTQLINQRKTKPRFFYQHDGIHMVDEGYWLVSNLIMNYLEPKKMTEKNNSAAEMKNSITLAEHLSASPKKLIELTTKKMALTRDAWLTYTGHTRPNLPIGLPIKSYQIELMNLERKIKSLLNK